MTASPTRTPDEVIAKALQPSLAYQGIQTILRDTLGASDAIKTVADRAIDGLDITVDILQSTDPETVWQADVTERSRRSADRAIESVADSVDRCTAALRADSITGLLDDIERTLVDIPQDWREAATTHGVLPLWHDAAASLGGLERLVEWSTRQDEQWVKWFTQGITESFFNEPTHIDAVLEALDKLPSRGKAGQVSNAIANLWVDAILRSSKQGLAHLNAIGVHEHLKGTTRQALVFFDQKGWSPDPSMTNWPHVMALQSNLAYSDLHLHNHVAHFLARHMDAIATTWPHMAVSLAHDKLLDGMANIEACTDVSLWHLVSQVPDKDLAELAARLDAHSMRLQTAKPRSQSITRRF